MGLMEIIQELMNPNQGKTPPGATPPYMPTSAGAQTPGPAPATAVQNPITPMMPGMPKPQPNAPYDIGPPKSLAGDLGIGPNQQPGPPRAQGSELLEPILPNQISVPQREKAETWSSVPWYKDSDKMSVMLASLSNSFGNMTLRGNQGMRGMNNMLIQEGMENIEENKTMKYLAENNPELFKVMTRVPPGQRGEYMKLAMQKKFGLNNQFRTNTSGVTTDEKTGRQYVVTSDGHGNNKIEFLKDGAGNPLTGATSASEADIEVKLQGIKLASDKGSAFFDKAEGLKNDIRIMEEAQQALADGADSGFLVRYLPAFDEATQRLRTAANSAGINIINSATFGALSEKEMSLALSTGIPIGLNEQQLQQYLAARIQAQEKLYEEITNRAIDLNSGTHTLGEWQKIWKESEANMQYDDAYADPWTDIKYDKNPLSDDDGDDDDDIIDVTTPVSTPSVNTGPRRRRY